MKPTFALTACSNTTYLDNAVIPVSSTAYDSFFNTAFSSIEGQINLIVKQEIRNEPN